MIFGYSIPQVKKAAVSFVIAAAALAAFFIHFDPNLTQALVVLIGAIASVATVFTAKHHSADDAAKALKQLEMAALTVVGFFVTVPSTTNVKIGAAIGVFVSAYAVYKARNAPA